MNRFANISQGNILEQLDFTGLSIDLYFSTTPADLPKIRGRTKRSLPAFDRLISTVPDYLARSRQKNFVHQFGKRKSLILAAGDFAAREPQPFGFGFEDLRRMGGLKNALPITYATFVVGALAISGIPGFSGFFSKDRILYEAFARGHTRLWAIGLLTSLLTAIYMFRLVFLAFFGDRPPSPSARRP